MVVGVDPDRPGQRQEGNTVFDHSDDENGRGGAEAIAGAEAPRPRRGGTARTGLIGAVLGVGALVGGLALATGGADAQQATTSAAVGADATAVTQAAAGADTGSIENGEIDLEGLDAAFEAHLTCVDDVLGTDGDAEVDLEDLTDAEWEALETELAACDEALEPYFAELDQAYEAYEACLVDNGVVLDDVDEADEYDDWEDGDWEDGDYEEPAAIALVENEDGSTFIEFGDGDGTVTIAKTDGEIVVSADGDVVTENVVWEDFDDPAFEACEDLLPEEELFLDELYDDFDEDELDWDEFDWDEGELDEDDAPAEEG